MTSSTDVSPLSKLNEDREGIWIDSLAWACVPAENEMPEGPQFKRDWQTELWLNWDIERGEGEMEQREAETPTLPLARE
jgi:hypothetical protein